MGYIYKITNKINGKSYVGQTVKDFKIRFRQHLLNYNKEYFSQIVLYKAFKKYGVENFIFEPIEEVENKDLDDREKYWIIHNNSYLNGYNSTIGGRTVKLYNWDEEDIIKKYYELGSARKVAKVIGCDHGSIDKILNKNNIKRFTQTEILSKYNIIIEGNDFKKSFLNATDCGKWFIDNKHSKSSNINNVTHYLRECARKNKTYCNFKIYYESKI